MQHCRSECRLLQTRVILLLTFYLIDARPEICRVHTYREHGPEHEHEQEHVCRRTAIEHQLINIHCSNANESLLCGIVQNIVFLVLPTK